jgi:hypothetical protein
VFTVRHVEHPKERQIIGLCHGAAGRVVKAAPSKLGFALWHRVEIYGVVFDHLNNGCDEPVGNQLSDLG